MRKKRKTKKFAPKIFKPPKNKYFLISAKTILFLLSIAGLISFFFWLFKGDLFKVKSIDCNKNGFGCLKNESSLLETLYGQNIFLLKTRKFSQDFIKKNPMTYQIKVKKILPSSLKITLYSREPIAIVQTEKEVLLIDSSGFIFGKKENLKEKLPTIILSHGIAIGETITAEKEKKAILLIKKLQESFINFEQINLSGGDFLEVISPEKMIATFSAQKALSPQVDSLQYILHHSRIGKKVIKVDLRFDKPILVAD